MELSSRNKLDCLITKEALMIRYASVAICQSLFGCDLAKDVANIVSVKYRYILRDVYYKYTILLQYESRNCKNREVLGTSHLLTSHSFFY